MSAEYVTSPQLEALNGIKHAFFTRNGGVSTGDHTSLNLGSRRSDKPENVQENRKRAAKVFNVSPQQLVFCKHVHGGKVLNVKNSLEELSPPEADGMVTNVPGLALAAISADCAPILLVDPEARIIGAAHASWTSTLAGITENIVKAMQALGANPANIHASIGPCLQQSSFEIKEDVEQAFLSHDTASKAFISYDEVMRLNLSGYLCHKLKSLGLTAIYNTGYNTYTEEDTFFSSRRARHRGENYGAMASFILLA